MSPNWAAVLSYMKWSNFCSPSDRSNMRYSNRKMIKMITSSKEFMEYYKSSMVGNKEEGKFIILKTR